MESIIVHGLLIIATLSVLGFLTFLIVGAKELLADRKKYKKAVKQTRNKQKEFEERRKRNFENMKLHREEFDRTKERIDKEFNKHFK
ncbi:hypothetical protein [Mammaliicoccus sp. R-M63]|uniref:hypothetical protein n=1 Tax=Mammaliicoccus sp. R-M63 TaxID=2898722 RepID=UPI001EFB2DAA|nr:hypothetical protein [Mammaliicoccus sp. R-M63]